MDSLSSRLKPLSRIILIGLIALSILAVLAYIVAFLYVAANRIGYPYELEWIEGGFVGQTGRIAAGQSVYGPPTVEFTPFLYTPLFFYLSAAVAKILGTGFAPLRIVSVAAALIAMAGMFLLVYRRNGNIPAGLFAAGLLAASYRVTGAWLDVGRVDSLAIALLVLFLLALPASPGRLRWVLSGAAAALMFLTKQSLLAVVVPFFAVHLIQYRSRALWMAAGFLLPVGIVTGVMNATSGGWYSFYTFDLLGQQADWLGRDAILSFWKTDLLRHFFPALGLAGAGLFFLLREKRSEFWQWLALLAGAIACSFLARIKAGGYDNVLLPAVTVTAILFGAGWDRLRAAVSTNPGLIRHAAGIAAVILVLYQFYHLRYSPAAQLPTERNDRTAADFIEYLAEQPGDVYVPYHTHYAAMAGKPAYAHQSALWDVLRGDAPNRGKAILAASITEALADGRFSQIIVDGDGEWNFLAGLEDYYQLRAEVLDPDLGPTPVTGWQISPRLVFQPKDNLPPPIPPSISGVSCRIPFAQRAGLFPCIGLGPPSAAPACIQPRRATFCL
jgi:hypothetical protein